VFGSYYLQVHTRSTDIDAICVFKSDQVTSEAFFASYAQHISKDSNFKDVCEIDQARVPIIKCLLMNIQFDLLFASVDDPQKMVSLLSSQKDLSQLKIDMNSMKCLRGRIGCDNILQNVSDLKSF
jgi:poly(A) polymerase Pap1